MGGEPLCPQNAFLTNFIIKEVKEKLPTTKIWVWTGYLYNDLKKSQDKHIQNILNSIDVLVDGPYLEAERDITLPFTGSRNQRVYYFDHSSTEN